MLASYYTVLCLYYNRKYINNEKCWIECGSKKRFALLIFFLQEFKRELYQKKIEIESLNHRFVCRLCPGSERPGSVSPLCDFRQRWDSLESETVSRQVRTWRWQIYVFCRYSSKIMITHTHLMFTASVGVCSAGSGSVPKHTGWAAHMAFPNCWTTAGQPANQHRPAGLWNRACQTQGWWWANCITNLRLTFQKTQGTAY